MFLEVPTAADILPLAVPAGVEVTRLPRRTADAAEPAPHGARLIAAVVRAVQELPGGAGPAPHALDDVDVDAEILWEVPEELPRTSSGPYAWLAGEAGTVKGLRRHLVQEAGLDRGSVAFMGYWRLGKASD